MSAQKRACARCGIPCAIGSNTRDVVICRDCRASDPWFVEHMAVAS